MSIEPTPEPENAPDLNRKKSGIAKKVISFGVALILIAGFVVYKFVLPPQDYSGPATGTVIVEVDPGDSIAVIGNKLKKVGVISSVDRFISAANQNPASTSIQSGKFRVGLRIPAAQALSELLNPKNKVFQGVIIPEGLRVSDIVTILVNKTNVQRSEFEKALANPANLGLPEWANNTVEGFLFPALYEFPTNATATTILKAMITKARAEYSRMQLSDLCANGSKCSGLTAYQIVTGASIMQAEVHPRDFHKVARVILNRLAEPMRLQMDSTVAYGRNKKQVMLSDADLKTDTPYNTYLHDGLTPTPISNPGSAAIEAMLNPAEGDWLYFITVDLNTQETKFTRSYQEFLRFNDEFLSFCRNNPGTC